MQDAIATVLKSNIDKNNSSNTISTEKTFDFK